MTNEVHHVSSLEKPIRISDYAVGIFERIPTRKGIKKALKKELVLLNDKAAHSGDWLNNGDVIILLPEPIIHPVFEYNLDVIFEDDCTAIVHKPPALLTSGNQHRTVQNCLRHNLQISPEVDAFTTPKLMHRLDYETSGLLLVAKTHSSHQFLQNQFVNHQIAKTYLAVCAGTLEGTGIIDQDIDHKKALTKYQVLQYKASQKYGALTLVKLQPKTGRTHQIRKHLAFIGSPILGDKRYGNEYTSKYKRSHLLQASGLSFTDFVSKEKTTFERKMEDRFNAFFKL